MSETSRPNFMRYRRVADVISTEPVFASKMGTVREAVLKPNGDKFEFPKEVILITDYIHATGHDANSFGKREIISLAGRVLLDGETLPMPERPAAPEVAPEPEAPKTKKPEPAATKPKSVETPKKSVDTALKKAAAKPKAAPKPAAPEKAPEPEPAPAEAKAPEEPKEPAKPKRPTAKANGTGTALSAPMSQNGVVPFMVGCAVNSNLIAASQLLEIHDNTNEGKELRERLDKIIDEIQRRTVIPNSRAS